MRVLGIDPGLNGALICLENGRPIALHVMPVIEIKKGKSTKHEYDIPMIAKLLRSAAPEHVFIEKQQAMPMQGTVSMYSVGLGYGILRGLVTGLNLPHTLLHAKSWQKEMFRDCPKDDTKALAAIICGRLWPDMDFRASERCKKSHEGLADAALIGLYGERLLAGRISGEA
jgi:hypothetical protein